MICHYLWKAPETINYPESVTDAIQTNVILSETDIRQLHKAFAAELFEMAVEYVWSRAINQLRMSLLSFPNELILSLLGITDAGMLMTLPENFTIDLAYETGIIPQEGKSDLINSNELISSYDYNNSMMDKSAADFILKTVFAYIFSKRIDFRKTGFYDYLLSLKQRTAIPQGFSYYHQKITVRSLLYLLSEKNPEERNRNIGALLDEVVPMFWSELSAEDRWLVGRNYTEAVVNNDTFRIAVLKNTLLKSKGFDYVPDTISTVSYVNAAKRIIANHNTHYFYNTDAEAINYLSSLGSAIPKDAIGICISALLSVKLGNQYVHSEEAQPKVDQMIAKIKEEDFMLYFQEYLPKDEEILHHLQYDYCISRFLEFVKAKGCLEDATKQIRFPMGKDAESIKKTAERFTAELYQKKEDFHGFL